MRQIGYLQELYRDARSAKYRTCVSILIPIGGPYRCPEAYLAVNAFVDAAPYSLVTTSFIKVLSF